MHSLVTGLEDFLLKAKDKISSIWCLSNDLSEWSTKLRRYFEIEPFFDGFIISGDVGVRKPDSGIYKKFLETSKNAPDECIFVDDRVKNLDAAEKLGFQTIQFSATKNRHKAVSSYVELYEIL